MTNEIVKVETFFNEQIRFIQKDGKWLIPLIDIANALQVDRSNLTKMVNGDDIFTDLVGMVESTTPSGLQTLTAVTRDGIVAILVKLRSSKSRSKEQRNKIKEFQKWAIDTISKAMLGNISEIKPFAKNVQMQTDKSLIGALVEDQLQIANAMSKYANVDQGIAISMALSKVEFDTGADLTMWKNISPKGKPSKRLGVLLATDIGVELGLGNNSGKSINQILIKLGFLNRINGQLVLTQRGEQYAEAYPRTGIAPSGKSYARYDIKWQSEMVDILRKHLYEEVPKPERGLITGYI